MFLLLTALLCKTTHAEFEPGLAVQFSVYYDVDCKDVSSSTAVSRGVYIARELKDDAPELPCYTVFHNCAGFNVNKRLTWDQISNEFNCTAYTESFAMPFRALIRVPREPDNDYDYQSCPTTDELDEETLQPWFSDPMTFLCTQLLNTIEVGECATTDFVKQYGTGDFALKYLKIMLSKKYNETFTGRMATIVVEDVYVMTGVPEGANNGRRRRLDENPPVYHPPYFTRAALALPAAGISPAPSSDSLSSLEIGLIVLASVLATTLFVLCAAYADAVNAWSRI